jgi:hypothetical protein
LPPRWRELFALTEGQHGFFTVAQAHALDVSDQDLRASSRTRRASDLRGVHRFIDFPTQDHDELVACFLWSRGEGVISHGSALMVHQLSDYLSDRVEMTLPMSWKRRRVPKRILPFYVDLPEPDIQWWDAFRITTPRRSVDDFLAWGIRPDLAMQAVDEGVKRRLFWRRHIRSLYEK